ncbi:MAG: HAMP domain-containing histidine kinase [Deltaproteobacteria bacterium]|nr:HAMP domain-containing histidine kinase [Deltaproteobacteria bacterium]
MSDEVTAAEIREMTMRELRGILERLVLVRFGAALLLGVFAIAFAWAAPVGWRLWVLAGSAAVLGVTAGTDVRRIRRGPITVGRQLYLILTVFVVHSLIIVTTGGITSPFIILYLPLTAVGALSLGEARAVAVLLAPVVGTLWVLAGTASLGLGPAASPDLFGANPMAGGSYPWFFALVMTAATIIGAVISLAHRRALDRTVARTVAARREAVAAMGERNRELIELAGTLAHELKNPLASIQGLAGLLARKLPEGGREAEQAGVLLAEAKRMGATLDEFLNFSRPVGGLTVRAVEPRELAVDVAALCEGIAAERGIVLVVEAGGGEVRCDPRKVKQVLVNLLQNALDATRRGGRVTMRVRDREGGGAIFEIEDEGPGLAPEVRDRLFRPGVTTKEGGTGIGLTVARAIAEQHGGSLELGEREGGGCRATLVLPGGEGRG